MHMGRHGKPKIAHHAWAGAWLHKRRIANRYKLSTNRAQIYPCWFDDENNLTDRRHWHVGHARFEPWVGQDALDPGQRAVQKAAAFGGYRLSVVLTPGELEQLRSLSGPAAVQEFTIRAILGLARTGTTCCHLHPQDCLLEASRNERRQGDLFMTQCTPCKNASQGTGSHQDCTSSGVTDGEVRCCCGVRIG
jgi:hypothetical protein